MPVPFEWGQAHAFVNGRLYVALQDDLEQLLRYDVAGDRWDRIATPDTLALRTLVADGDRLLAR